MNYEVNGNNIFIIILITFLCSTFLMPIIKKVAIHVGAIDYPNERKVHKKPTPRLGGLAIFFAFLVGYMLFAESTSQMLSILIGGFVIVILGMIDDINPIKARYKFIVQIVAAVIVVFYGNIVLNDISILGINLVFTEPFNYLISILFIVSITNAINLIDGIDGLSSGISSIYFITISVIAILINKATNLDVTLSLIMLGSTLGFLVYNFPPASIFMGDSGSLFLGFIISIISLLGFKTATVTSLIIPILILAIPILDTLMAIVRRFLKGESIGKPDKEHIHHQFLKMNFSPRKTVLVIYGINILFSLVSILYAMGKTSIAMIIYGIIMLIFILLILNTDIIFKRKKGKNAKKH